MIKMIETLVPPKFLLNHSKEASAGIKQSKGEHNAQEVLVRPGRDSWSIGELGGAHMACPRCASLIRSSAGAQYGYRKCYLYCCLALSLCRGACSSKRDIRSSANSLARRNEPMIEVETLKVETSTELFSQGGPTQLLQVLHLSELIKL